MTNFKICGILQNQAKKEYEGDISFKYQFLINKIDGSLDIINVKSLNDLNLQNDEEVEILIEFSIYNGEIFYRAIN